MTIRNILKYSLLSLLLLLSACSWSHRIYMVLGIDYYSGVYIFPDKYDALTIGSSQQDVANLLGTPTLVNKFDKQHWYYVYQKSKAFAMFKENILEQNVLVLTFDNHGLLTHKELRTNTGTLLPYDNKETHLVYSKNYITPDLLEK